ncbi:MAG TPA: acyl-ACP--UDP-N-acetylglucosamine O-acyltransferase [Phycisphaerales bacterium]|nr:acyl-ACP--UDP-N-acetylglucosamine O-acyltransferase [Phycisphaerales bacterium]HMP36672.1 acyl-ACP--UDP-N-acetylglucosamine O-acyltransferase [Phycisphaerales bacterium]
MASIHPTAILEGEIECAEDVVVGPGCVLRGPLGRPIAIGPGTRLIGRCWLEGPLRLGARNTVYPFAALGMAPQDLKFHPEEPGAGLVIGDENVFRENVTLHRATSQERPTAIGSRNYFMAGSHAGHDCQVGDGCILANGAALGGHVLLGDRVIIGGGCMVHQFCRIGRGAMLSGGVGTGRDVPPFFTLTGINVVGSINLVGLRRSGADSATIEAVRWVYSTLYRRGTAPRGALAALRTRIDEPTVREYIEFIESSRRGICPATAVSSRRGTVSMSGPETDPGAAESA